MLDTMMGRSSKRAECGLKMETVGWNLFKAGEEEISMRFEGRVQ